MTDTIVAAAKRPPLSVFGVLGTTWRTFARAPLLFLGIAIVSELPRFIRLLSAPNAMPGHFDVAWLAVSFVEIFVISYTQTAAIASAVRILEGGQPHLGEALTLGLQRYLPVFGTTILAVLATYLGLLLVVVPGLIALCVYAVAGWVCVLERKGPLESLKASAVLSKTMRWRIGSVFAVLYGLIVLVPTIIIYQLAVRGHIGPSQWQWISLGAQVTWVTVAMIVPVVIYVELRGLKSHGEIANVFD